MHDVLVVDLCGTIVLENTTHGFFRNAVFAPPRRFFIRLLVSRVGFMLGRLLPEGFHRKLLFQCLRGVGRDHLLREARQYAAYTLIEHARSSVIDEIRNAQAAATRVYIASASIDVVVQAFAEELGADIWVASALAYGPDGRCLGRLSEDATARKLILLERQIGGPLGRFRVITDNIEDSDLRGGAIETRFIKESDV